MKLGVTIALTVTAIIQAFFILITSFANKEVEIKHTVACQDCKNSGKNHS